MPRRAHPVLICLATLALCACAGRPCRPVVITEVVEVPDTRLIYVPIPPALTRPPAIAEGPPSACLEVAIARRGELERCVIQLDEIARIQGTRADE